VNRPDRQAVNTLKFGTTALYAQKEGITIREAFERMQAVGAYEYIEKRAAIYMSKRYAYIVFDIKQVFGI